jgi:uncharacterized protein (DUF983 family)
MRRALELLIRGLLLRCPVCGKGKVFRSWFTMYEQCPVCHYTFEREVGYFTAAMALNLVVSELIVAAIVLPLSFNPTVPLVPLFLLGIPLAILLPFAFYRHSRCLWMSLDHFLNPAPGRGIPW